jgi:glycosyltransferase involved in cell wall biosynthesis
MSSLKILHIDNYSNVANQIASGQRALGHQAHVLQTWHDPDNHAVDFENYYDGRFPVNFYRMSKTFRLARDYDIVHVHGGIYPLRLDNIFLGLMGKPLVVHYHGSETRLGRGMFLKDTLPWAKIVATPDLLRWHPDAVFIPNPYSSRYPCAEWADDGPLRLLHAPSNRKNKGTEKIVRAISLLEERTDQFSFKLVEKLTNDELMREMAGCHVLIDQLSDERITGIPGMFGMISLEAMWLGKMAVAYLSPQSVRAYPEGLPVASPLAPSAEALADLLEEFVVDRERAKRTGVEGARYVRKHLSPELIARRHIDIYEQILD